MEEENWIQYFWYMSVAKGPNMGGWDIQGGRRRRRAPEIFKNCRNFGFMGVGSRVLRNQILYCGDPSWGPMGPQEVKNRGFGVPGGVWTPISSLPNGDRVLVGYKENLSPPWIDASLRDAMCESSFQ